MITTDDRDMFTRGCCHKLAQAISKITGWPVCAFFYEGQANIHAFVRTPRGTYVDIQGEHTEQEITKTWAWCNFTRGPLDFMIGEVSAEMLDYWDGHTLEWPNAIDRAAELAPVIVEGVNRSMAWCEHPDEYDL